MRITACGHAKHTGHLRDHNEDNYFVDCKHGLFVVADGMGGHDDGEIASMIAVDFIKDAVRRGISLQKAVGATHNAILMATERNIGSPGMGSTVVVAKFDDNQYEIVWVGDSRAYLWENNNLIQLTTDHSYVQRLLDYGHISEQEALNHPQRNIITRALGGVEKEQVEAESIRDTFYRGEQILLCSDGLTDEVSYAGIASVLSERLDEQQRVDKLVQKALDNGGSDNITAVLISAPDDAPEKTNRDITVIIDANQ
ncbi:MAG: serine/threonine-protein phosphatase [Gammaproteobacteria bacterium]|nr:serine/threonine-protein phosphatase [Gammaproteobacteria bacterium]MCK5090987.1 serine/threonine-protein phosphatase [Gammaproteobacteria bacterium]